MPFSLAAIRDEAERVQNRVRAEIQAAPATVRDDVPVADAFTNEVKFPPEKVMLLSVSPAPAVRTIWPFCTSALPVSKPIVRQAAC